MTVETTSTFGSELKKWRLLRRVSQLELANMAGISSRHLSFLESEKSQPSREMVLRLAKQLHISFRQVNTLLQAAGFSAAYASGNSETVRAIPLETMHMLLKSHDPYPAVIVNSHWEVVAHNAGMKFIFADVDPSLLVAPINTMRLSLHPKGLAPHITNLAEWRSHVFDRLARDIENSADPFLIALQQELLAYHKDYVPSSTARASLAEAVIPLRIMTRHGQVSIFGMTTVFGSPNDVTLSELAIESFFPADEATDHIFKNNVAIYARNERF